MRTFLFLFKTKSQALHIFTIQLILDTVPLPSPTCQPFTCRAGMETMEGPHCWSWPAYCWSSFSALRPTAIYTWQHQYCENRLVTRIFTLLAARWEWPWPLFVQHRGLLVVEALLNIFLLKEPKCSAFADLFSSNKQLSEECRFADNFEQLPLPLPLNKKAVC